MNKSKIIFYINNSKKLNYGIQILRLILSYLILQFHCLNIGFTKNKILIFFVNAFHFYVPIFYVISFYFSYDIIKFKRINKIKLRFKRIIIPYLIWPFLFFIMKNINYKICGEDKYNFNDLYIQFLTGKRIYDPFWYLCNLILSLILFCIISLLSRNNFLIIIQLLGILGSLYYQFHFYNNLFFRYIIEIRTLIKDFSKVIFYGAIGITLGDIKSISFLGNYRKRVVFFCIYSLYFIHDFLEILKHFYYLKCIIIGIGAIIIFILFSILPLENIENAQINKIIINITNYTGVVYYLHLKIKQFLENKIIIIKNGTFIGCIFIYIICYFICFLGIKFLRKTNLKYLFF